MPGASALGGPIPLPERITALELAPGQQYGLAQVGDDSQTNIFPIDAFGTLGDAVPIVGALTGPDRIEFSPAGSAAAIYSSKRQRIQVLGYLPRSPQVLREFDASGLGAPVHGFAISDDGQAILIGTSGPDDGLLALVTADNQVNVIGRDGDFAIIQFFANSHDVVVADRKWNRVFLLEDVTGISTQRVIATEAEGLKTPSDVRTSAIGRRVFVSDQGVGGILDLDVDSGVAAWISCSFFPTRFRTLRQESSLLVSDFHSGNFWIFDIARTDQLSFVPNFSGVERAGR
jgi:hypothetical protein